MELSNNEIKRIREIFDSRWVVANEEEIPLSCDREMYNSYLYAWNWYLSGYKDGMAVATRGIMPSSSNR